MTEPITNPAVAHSVGVANWQPAGLTAEGLLSYCSSRLQSLDDLIKSRFAEQQKRNEDLKIAGALLNTLNAAQELNDTGSAGGQTALKGWAAEVAKLYAKTTDPDLRAKICEAYKKYTGNDLKGDGKGGVEAWQCDANKINLNPAGVPAINKETWSTFVGTIKTVQDGLTKDSELSMIQLQSVVTQRQQAVQLTTQIMSTMSESMKQVLGNIRP